MTPPTPERLCANCQTRPATLEWGGNDVTFAIVHGCTVRWCRRCAVEAQLAFARERAADIPALEAELAILVASEGA